MLWRDPYMTVIVPTSSHAKTFTACAGSELSE
eukprot:CAMPEP_0172693054 /NCGR_PEP_ID=MMETSP1074-20121228/25695_1 /TAXON_ID=2916 /ORGANISM="Ceratium fusus, Strain PA161109" /LENGTH=31 /DNA_ID= /DNA_START= /DNA_END= /DNA_ORIENTATION=